MGRSFGNCSTDSWLETQIIELRRHGVTQRLSERPPHSPAITLRRPRIEPILLGVSLQQPTCPPIKWAVGKNTATRLSLIVAISVLIAAINTACTRLHTSYAYVDSYRVNKSAQACAKRASSRKRRLSRR